MRSMNLHVPKGPGHKRHSAGSAYGACGVGWRAGQQLAWLTAKIAPLEGHMLRSICWQRYQCCGVMSRVADQHGHCGHEFRRPPSFFGFLDALVGNH